MASCVSLHDFLVSRCFSNDDTQTIHGGELFLFSFGDKKARSFFSFSLFSHALTDGRESYMSTLPSFSVSFTVGWRNQDGRRDEWDGKTGPLIRFGDEIEGGCVNILSPPAGYDKQISSGTHTQRTNHFTCERKDAEHVDTYAFARP